MNRYVICNLRLYYQNMIYSDMDKICRYIKHRKKPFFVFSEFFCQCEYNPIFQKDITRINQNGQIQYLVSQYFGRGAYRIHWNYHHDRWELNRGQWNYDHTQLEFVRPGMFFLITQHE